MKLKIDLKDKKTRIILIVLAIIIVVSGIVLAVNMSGGKKEEPKQEQTATQTENKEKKKEKVKREEGIKIFSGTDRPIAVMIDNHSDAWPQAGLNQAYMVYEIIVEGGETRLMALFKGQEVEKIGPVRSSRHYFLDYALENDAIYAHYGWSPKAKKDISKLGVNNINGITESTEIFWRVSDKAAPHNVATTTAKLLKSAEAKGYKTTSTKKSVLNYTKEEVTLNEGVAANKISIPHSNLQNVSYQYDAENKVYKRFARGKEQTDWTSGKAVTTKNIIITYCDNVALEDGSNKGRQDLKNIGTFDGYYITNGKAIKIKCTKEGRDKQTKYTDLNGKEIKVNDGNTFVNICPTTANVVLE